MAANFSIPRETITVGSDGGYFTVRGMNSEDITFLTLTYLDDIKLAVARQSKKLLNVGDTNGAVAELVKDLAKDFPMLCVEIISRCADATTAEDVENFRMLSFVKQFEALQKIIILSTSDGGIEIKNLVGVVASALEANGLSVGPLMTKLKNTIEASGNL